MKALVGALNQEKAAPVRNRVLSTLAIFMLSMGRGRRPAVRRQEPDPGTSSSVESV